MVNFLYLDVDPENRKPNRIVLAIIKWLINIQGFIDFLIYGLVEYHARRLSVYASFESKVTYDDAVAHKRRFSSTRAKLPWTGNHPFMRESPQSSKTIMTLRSKTILCS